MFTRLEWFRNPLSRLEKTLRLPLLMKQVLYLFLRRIVVIWGLFYVLLYLLTSGRLISIVLGFFLAAVFELFFLSRRYRRYVLPKHRKNIEVVREETKQISKYPEEELIDFIEKTTNKSAWSIINIGYLALPSWGWEIVFKTFYRLAVKGPPTGYRDLLVGFDNKTIESNMALWEIAQETNEKPRQRKLKKYLETYGSRVDDFDLKHETLREKPETVSSLVDLYKRIESPASGLKSSKKRRQVAEKEVADKLRIPQLLFRPLLKITQKNVALREDRRFYEFEFDYHIRKAVLLLADKKHLAKEDIFDKSWRDIKYE